jgi:hypothetical protein
MQPCQKAKKHRWPSVASSAGLAIIVSITACNQRHATLFPDGKQWLGWSTFEREQYVGAYVEGVGEGFRNGCETALEASLPPGDGQRFVEANSRCASHAPFAGRNLDPFITSVTLFFQKYPEQTEQRNLGVSVVLRRLDEGKTIDEIHAEFSPHS